MPDISLIIVNFNVKFYLEQALHSFEKALKGFHAEIFVVDNASTDGSVAMLKERFQKVHIIANRENVGFAKANNQAISRATGRVICLINPDTLVREDTFRVCYQFLTVRPDVGMVGCKILNPDGSLQLACRRSIPTPWIAFTKITGLSSLFPKSSWFGKYNLTYLDPDVTTEVEAISGSFMMIKKETLVDTGLLDEQFFMYGEDLDLCYRVHQKGWKIFYLPETQIVHYKGTSTREASFDHLKMFYTAMSLFVTKHFPRGFSILPRWFLMFGILLRGLFSKVSQTGKKLVFPMIDFSFLQLSLILALLKRFGHIEHWQAYLPVNAIYSLVWLSALSAIGLYRRGLYSFTRSSIAVILGLIINASLTFFFPQYAFSRYVVLVAGLFNILFIGGWRLLIRVASIFPGIPFLGTVGKTLVRRRALIFGVGPASREIFRRINTRINRDYEVVGFLSPDSRSIKRVKSSLDLQILGTLDDIHRVIKSHRIQEIIFTPDTFSYKRMLDIIIKSKNLHLEFKLVPKHLDVIIGKTSIDSLEHVPFIDVDYPMFRQVHSILKRTVDLLLSFIFLLIVWPYYIYLVLSPQYTKIVETISDGFDHSISLSSLLDKNKNRISGINNTIFMLPYVFTGKLSFVGSEKQIYKPESQGVGIKPGLTGLVQLQTERQLEKDEKEQYHLYYLKNYTVLLDAEILIKAFLKALQSGR